MTQKRERAEPTTELDRFFELSLDMLCIANADGYFKRINQAFEDVLGWTMAELLARPFIDFVHPEDHAGTIAQVEKLAIGEPVIHFENRYCRKDGAWRYLSWRSSSQPDGTIFATARDVTDQKLSANRLARALKDLEDIKLALDEHAIVDISNPRGKIIAVNEKFCTISGYHRDELLGQNHGIINSGHHPKEFMRQLWETIAQGDVWKGEIKNRAKDGTFFWVDTTIVPFRDSDGEIYQYVAIHSDITERKAAEEEIFLRNQELQELNRVLEAVNEELDQFNYAASHDLQEPLRTILTYTGFLREDLGEAISKEVAEDVEFLNEAASRMRALVTSLLQLARSSRTALTRSPCPLDQCVDGALENLHELIEESGAVVARAELPSLAVDQDLMTQVFQNLVGNAIKYQTNACPKVEIGAALEDDTWVIFVADNGIGIEPQYIEQIFAPFKRLQSAGKFAGSGIGLAICKRIVERHGGRIWAEENVNAEQGTVFKFTVPEE